mmetsp:Transcript_28297/g.42259  ORF Transcript_28297/g.42259 Transcript_28297/m.42259 type:complete len:518 (+) Transcript_28297:51-1604(+)
MTKSFMLSIVTLTSFLGMIRTVSSFRHPSPSSSSLAAFGSRCVSISSLSIRNMNDASVLSNQQRKRSQMKMSSVSNGVAKTELASRLDGLDKPTVWHEFSPLAVKHQSINLGQGFPDWNPPQFAIDAMIDAVTPTKQRNANQYARSAAHLPLAQVLAEEYSAKWNRSIDPMTEVATAVGCTNALYCALQGLIDDGDEVILLEPAFDIYIAQVKMAGGIPKFIPLRTPQNDNDNNSDVKYNANDMFTLDFDELEHSISSPQTKVLLLNTPHNPTGKMFNMEEMKKIADIVQRNTHVTVISDEVYEHIVFDKEKSPHISIASLPGMYEHTLTLNSSGKTFSCTGWKVGWAVGPPHLTRAVTSVQQWVNFSAPTPNQDAIAMCLKKAWEPYEGHDSYYAYLASEYKRKRDILIQTLNIAGITPIVPDGGFFIMGDTSSITFPEKYREEVTDAMPTNPMPRDWAMSRWMTKEVGVTAIPPSAFYDTENIDLAQNLLRFAYCKGDDTILEAQRRFQFYFEQE